MCFSTRGLRRMPWNSYGLVEDMEYSWSLRVAGERIAFEPESRFWERWSVAVVKPRRINGGAGSLAGGRSAEVSRPVVQIGPARLVGESVSVCELTIPSMGSLHRFVLILVLDVFTFSTTGSTVCHPPRFAGPAWSS